MSFSELPAEILVRIFEDLPLEDLNALSKVSKFFLAFSEDDLLWKPKCENGWNELEDIL
jgi:hypothetical protein